MSEKMHNPLDNRKAVFGWAMYDWANSVFATTVMAGFFPVFFKEFWSAGADINVSTARLGLANSMASTMVALLAPVLGAIADKGSAKKKFLMFFAYMGVVMTASLTLVSKGNWTLAILLYAVATIGFSGANVFYDALITLISSKERMDFVSTLGFSLGYLGGGLLFAVNVWMALRPGTFGFADTGQAIRFSFLLVGIWWAVFSVPVFLFVREPRDDRKRSALETVGEGLRQLGKTIQEIGHLRRLVLFLAAFWFYMDGVNTVIRMAVDYGMSIGFQPNDLIVALLITQFVGFPSSLVFGYLGTRIGANRAIFMAIGVYLFVCIGGAFMQSKNDFFVLAMVVGLVQGGIQALSRSYYAKIIPVEKSGEYFGFYNMMGKFSAVLGPLLMGMVGLLIRSMGYSSNVASRGSITSIALLFVAGGVLLYMVREEKWQETCENSR